jgi:hypothetical protein
VYTRKEEDVTLKWRTTKEGEMNYTQEMKWKRTLLKKTEKIKEGKEEIRSVHKKRRGCD